MYAYLDRRPSELPHDAQMTVMALRLWALAVRARDNPLPPLESLLGRWDVAGALWPAHGLFMWIGAHARRTLLLGCPTCGAVSEDEALLLCAVFADAAAGVETLYPPLADLVHSQAVPRAAVLAQRLNGELTAGRNEQSTPLARDLSERLQPGRGPNANRKLH